MGVTHLLLQTPSIELTLQAREDLTLTKDGMDRIVCNVELFVKGLVGAASDINGRPSER